MLNLPALPGLQWAPGEPATTTSLVMPIAPVADQLPGQLFDGILAKTLANQLTEEKSVEDSLSPLPSEVFFMADATTKEYNPIESLGMALSARAIDMAFRANQFSAVNDEGSSTIFPGDFPPSAAVTAQLSSSFFSGSFQAAKPYHTSTAFHSPNDSANTATAPVSENSQNPTTPPAIFSDSGKILPPSMTPAASALMKNPLATPAVNSSSPALTRVSLTSELGSPVWPDEFGQKITWIATQRLQSAELRLNPAHLGPIEITLQLSGEQGAQQLSAQFLSHHAAVRETIEANLPRLREIMAESGITLLDASVSAETSQQQTENDRRQRTSRQATADGSNASFNQPETHLAPIGRHEGMINTFA